MAFFPLFCLLISGFARPDSGLKLVKPGADAAFYRDQLRYPRFRVASGEKTEAVAALFAAAGLEAQPQRILIRVFKREKELELWAFNPSSETYQRIKAYPVCAVSGVLGPKRREGDLQIPEGFYHIDRFNPASNFYLSLGLNYPNESDRVLGHPRTPGSDIFIHGACVTIGCVPITDPLIKELYLICVAARANGQRKIPVHIYPARLKPENLADLIQSFPEHAAFWENLAEGYSRFEQTRQIPSIQIDPHGKYRYP